MRGRRPAPRSVEVRVGAAERRAFLGAAYAMTDQAYVRVRRRGKAWTVGLLAKARANARTLERRFRLEYENQRVRWALAGAARGGTPPGPGRGAPGELPRLQAERRERIEALLAGCEKLREDPLGIAAPWGQSRRPAR